MKFIKLVPAMAMATLLVACAKTSAPEAPKAPVVEAPKASEKTVVYQCLNKKAVTVTYQFLGDDAQSAKVMLGKKVIGELARDKNNADFTAFASEKHTWGTETGLTPANAEAKSGANLVMKGKKHDTILAKLCEVNPKATEKANQM
ncbi:hypothetical protein A4G19_08130 [Pasteurellaceae bacterium Macca]|nr:hypothetical protein [Pasteurellaceae bacterium Macca]